MSTTIAEQVQQLEIKLAELLDRDSFIVPITTFDPEPFALLKEIKAVVQRSGDDYLATFFDANVNVSGCNEVDAIENLKDMLLSRFDYLDSLPPEKLGPGLARQIAVLRAFIRRRGSAVARIITKELAEKIADKLKATKIKSRNKVHDEDAVEHEGRLIAIISIRRGSAKDQGHDHIPRDLQIRPSQARFLAQCSWSREAYLENLRERGLLAEEDQDEQEEPGTQERS